MTATVVERRSIRHAGASGRACTTRDTPDFCLPTTTGGAPATGAFVDPLDILAGMPAAGDDLATSEPAAGEVAARAAIEPRPRRSARGAAGGGGSRRGGDG